jgi:hypothetical protein
MSIESDLRQAMSEHVAAVSAPPDLVAGVRRRHRRRVLRLRVLTAAVSAVAVLGAFSLYEFGPAEQSGPATVGPSAGPALPPPVIGAGPSCVADVPSRVLPTWARAGFTAAEPRMPYVLSTGGDIAAILFGNPMAAPPRKELNNKILWVSRVRLVSNDALVITARLDGSKVTAVRTVPGGPGPSGIDLPQAGCWHLTLTWSGYTDTMDLRYSPQPG